MYKLRVLHTFVGCFFAPLLIYFVVSGMWQTFELHKHKKTETPTATQSLLHNLSNPHTDGMRPGLDSKDGASFSFKLFSEIMAIGFILTALLGIQMALQNKKNRKAALWAIVLGMALPVALLFLHS